MKEQFETVREGLGTLANADNWRDVSLEGDDETAYDAMAWSPPAVDDPLFHEPWAHARQALDALAKIEVEHERVKAALREAHAWAIIRGWGVSTNSDIRKVVENMVAALAAPEPKEPGLSTAAEFIRAYFGDRCAEHEPGCLICEAWKFYDSMQAAAEPKEPIK